MYNVPYCINTLLGVVQLGLIWEAKIVMCIYIYIHINVSLDQYSFTRTSTNLVPTYMAWEHAIVMVVVIHTSTPHLLMMKILG